MKPIHEMKDNIDLWAAFAAAFGAMFRAIKKGFSKRETFVNMIVAGVLSFGILFAISTFLPQYIKDPKIVLCITFFTGWIANDFTDSLEKGIIQIVDIFIEWLRKKFNK